MFPPVTTSFHLYFWIFQKIMWKLNKSIEKEFLPAQPAELAIEPWWGVRFVNFTLEEFKVSFIRERGFPFL